MIQAVARDYAAICDHATDRLLDRLGGGDAASCADQARADPDDSAEEIDGEIEVAIDGGTATADFTDNDGIDQHVTFVEDGGRWRVDAIERAGRAG